MNFSIYSISQHIISPFDSTNSSVEKISNWSLREKIAVVALSILASFAAVYITRILSFAFVGIGLFYSLTGCKKIKERFTLDDKTNEAGNKILHDQKDPIIEQQPADSEHLTSTKKGDSTPFFKELFLPLVKKICHQAVDENLCFIKKNSDFFSEWFQHEYKKEDSIQKSNLLYLLDKCPEIKKGFFISIRGDGDCTIRSVGVGLLLQEIQGAMRPSFFERCQQIAIELEKDANFTTQSELLSKKVEELKKEAGDCQLELDTHPERYRLPSNYLNEEGCDLKATLEEKLTVADILDKHFAELKKPDNQKVILDQIKKLKSTAADLNRLYLSEIESVQESDPVKKMIEILLERDEFDALLISFLRNASALYTILHMEKLDLYVKQLNNQEQIILGELSLFDLLIQRANARQPNEEYLQGTVNDALSLAMLFHQPIVWYRCEVNFKPPHPIIHNFSGKNAFQSQPLYILNRPGHSDLIMAAN